MRRTACIIDKKLPPSSDRETILQYRVLRQGGAFTLSGGDSRDFPGANITIRNSTFLENSALMDDGGVFSLNTWAEAHFEGDHNIFTRNTCAIDGGVLSATENASVTVEGGIFNDNKAGQARGQNLYRRNRGASFSRELQ